MQMYLPDINTLIKNPKNIKVETCIKGQANANLSIKLAHLHRATRKATLQDQEFITMLALCEVQQSWGQNANFSMQIMFSQRLS